jgi:serine protease Do
MRTSCGKPVIGVIVGALAALALAACSSPPVVGPGVVPDSGGPSSPGISTTAAQSPIVPAPSDAQTPVAQGSSGGAGTVATIDSGIAEISATMCGASAKGTGFLVGPNLVMTSAQDIFGETSLSVFVDGTVTSAEVLGYDQTEDLGLIQLAEPVNGHVFTFSVKAPHQGDTVSAIGFPHGAGPATTTGVIIGVDQTQVNQADLIYSNASTTVGSGGGPLLSPDGTVAGVVSAFPYWTSGPNSGETTFVGSGYAVQANAAEPMEYGWASEGTPVAATSCSGSVPSPAASKNVILTVDSSNPQAKSIGESLQAHGAAINSREWSAAYAGLTAQEQSDMGGVAAWSASQSTSLWKSVSITQVTGTSATGVPPAGTTASADVSLTTTQLAAQGYNGQTCSTWSLDYGLVWNGSTWLIDTSANIPGSPLSCGG